MSTTEPVSPPALNVQRALIVLRIAAYELEHSEDMPELTPLRIEILADYGKELRALASALPGMVRDGALIPAADIEDTVSAVTYGRDAIYSLSGGYPDSWDNRARELLANLATALTARSASRPGGDAHG